MGIFSRISTLFKAEANAAIDKMEDPEKVLNQTIRDMQEQLNSAKTQVAESIAYEKRLKIQYDKAVERAKEWEGKAMQAVNAGRDDLAVEALSRKEEAEKEAAQFRVQWEAQKIFQSIKADRHTEQVQKRVQESTPMRNAVHCDHADAGDPEAKERCDRRKTPQTLIGANIRKPAKNTRQNTHKEEGDAGFSAIGEFHLQDPRDHHRRNDLSRFVLILPDGLTDRHPDAAFVVGTLHIAGGVDLQHGFAVATVFLTFVRVPLLPDLRVQGLQGAGQGAFGGEHRPIAFREGIELQALRHLAALIQPGDPVFEGAFLLIADGKHSDAVFKDCFFHRGFRLHRLPEPGIFLRIPVTTLII